MTMILAVDTGNTNIAFGIYNGSDWINHWRIHTDVNKTSDEYEILFRSMINTVLPNATEIDVTVFSSVVPSLNEALLRVLETITGKKPLVIDPSIALGLDLDIENRKEIGADLIADALAGVTIYKTNCIIIDFGTALTFTTVNNERKILGVAIAPGIYSALDGLVRNTAQLPAVSLEKPESALGKNTVHAIQAGLVFGYIGMVEGIVAKIKGELAGPVTVIATGGLSRFIAPHTKAINVIEPWLTLDGLRIAGEVIGA